MTREANFFFTVNGKLEKDECVSYRCRKKTLFKAV